MKKLRIRHIIWYFIAIILASLNSTIGLLSIVIFFIALIDYIVSPPKEKKQKIKEYEVPDEQNMDYEKIRVLSQMAQAKNDELLEYRKNVDLRQFKNRNDVTIEEVEKYLWVHYRWEGREYKEIIVQEIVRVSNLTEDCIDEIMHDHYHHEWREGEYGAGCWIRNDEYKKEIEYNNKKARKANEEYIRILRNSESKIRNIFKADASIQAFYNKLDNRRKIKYNDEEFKYRFYYDEWLKEKGFI